MDASVHLSKVALLNQTAKVVENKKSCTRLPQLASRNDNPISATHQYSSRAWTVLYHSQTFAGKKQCLRRRVPSLRSDWLKTPVANPEKRMAASKS
jgi:hypothetical protein